MEKVSKEHACRQQGTHTTLFFIALEVLKNVSLQNKLATMLSLLLGLLSPQGDEEKAFCSLYDSVVSLGANPRLRNRVFYLKHR